VGCHPQVKNIRQKTTTKIW